MERYEARERDDILLFESPTGISVSTEDAPAAQTTPGVAEPVRVLYVVSLYGVYNHKGERIDGDALIVRAPNLPDRTLLAAVLGCTDSELPHLLDQGGTWSIRQISSIDGYRLRFEPN
jgi:hypothetical protein